MDELYYCEIFWETNPAEPILLRQLLPREYSMTILQMITTVVKMMTTMVMLKLMTMMVMMMTVMTCMRREPKATRYMTLRLKLPATKFQGVDHHYVLGHDAYGHPGHDHNEYNYHVM